MTFELTFTKFMDYFNDHNIEHKFNKVSQLHYREEPNAFVMYFRSYEDIDYVTEVTKEQIIMFGRETGRSAELALNDFRLEYFKGAIRLKDMEVPIPVRGDGVERPIAKDIIDEGQDVIDESKSYDEFIVRKFETWEKNALAALKKLDFEKSFMDLAVQKTFGEFLQTLFNGINNSVFFNQVRRYVKSGMKEGLKAAEADVGVDVGVSMKFEQRVDALVNQELTGYTINGKKWHGMDGVTAQLRQKILNEVQIGVTEKEGIGQLSKRVKDLFTTAKDVQAERISRTETVRFISEGKLRGYLDSEVTGLKNCLTIQEDRDEVCNRLERVYADGIPFEEDFIDPNSGKAFPYPPFHVNCRCTLGFVPV